MPMFRLSAALSSKATDISQAVEQTEADVATKISQAVERTKVDVINYITSSVAQRSKKLSVERQMSCLRAFESFQSRSTALP